MSLMPFLRGVRPNPAPARFRLRHRHAEGGPWTVVAEAASAAGLEEELRAGTGTWSVRPMPGDLVLGEGPRGGRREYGVADDGTLRRLPRPLWVASELPDATWAEAWEGAPSADGMIEGTEPWLSPPILVGLACAFARTSLDRVPPDEGRPEGALKVAEAWAQGDRAVGLAQIESALLTDDTNAAMLACRSALTAALYAVWQKGSWHAYLSEAVVAASRRAVDAAVGRADAGLPERAPASETIAILSAARAKAEAELCALVRQRVPLAELVRAMTAPRPLRQR